MCRRCSHISGSYEDEDGESCYDRHKRLKATASSVRQCQTEPAGAPIGALTIKLVVKIVY